MPTPMPPASRRYKELTDNSPLATLRPVACYPSKIWWYLEACWVSSRPFSAPKFRLLGITRWSVNLARSRSIAPLFRFLHSNSLPCL
jgi:hypothetical protein